VWKNMTEFKLHDVVVKVNGLDENTTYNFRAPIEEKVGKMKVENLKHGTFTTQQCKQNGKFLLLFFALGNGILQTLNRQLDRLAVRGESTRSQVRRQRLVSYFDIFRQISKRYIFNTDSI